MPQVQRISWYISLALAIGLSSSRAVLSIGTVLLFILALWHWNQTGRRFPHRGQSWRLMTLGVVVMFSLPILGLLHSDNLSEGLESIYRKLPLGLLLFSYWVLPRFTPRQMKTLALVFVLTQLTIGLASLVVHWFWPSWLIEARVGGRIPAITGVSHIYYGVILAYSNFLAFYFYWRQRKLKGIETRIWGVSAFVGVLIIHLYASRTGLIAWYSGLTMLLIYLMAYRKRWWLGLGLFIGLIGMSWLANQVPLIESKVQESISDLYSFQSKDQDLSYRSASLRLLAWSNAIEIIFESPWIGTGIADVEAQMELNYQHNGSYSRARSPLLNPHNQYLTYLIAFGIPGLALLLAVIFIPIFALRGPPMALGFCMSGVLLASLMFENILERQIGMTFFCVIYLWLPFWQYTDEIS